MSTIYSHTTALCPTCRSKVTARTVEIEGRVYLEKFCTEHGRSKALISSDADWYRRSLHYLKPGSPPKARSVDEYQACPDSCGLCPQHAQHTCLPVIEITDACDLDCPICLKNWDQSLTLSPAEFAGIVDTMLLCEGSVPVINLSGGEPTLHPDINSFFQIAADKGVMQTTVSTNGLRLLKDQGLRESFKELDVLVALQFDGFRAETYRKLRNADLVAEKLKLIEILEAEGIKFSLVATIAAGINDDEVSRICDFFFDSAAISLMFQPSAFTGNATKLADPLVRTTIPDIVHALDQATHTKREHFNPLPCSHPSCFALAYYLKIDEHRFLNMKEFLGEANYLDAISNRTLPGLDGASYEIIKNRVYDMWSARDQFASDQQIMQRIKSILTDLSSHGFSPRSAFGIGSKTMKAVFIHQFMDVHTMDLSRLVKCCNHYPRKNGKLIPMCAHNVFHQGEPS